MITTYCGCGGILRLPEGQINGQTQCSTCSTLFRHISAETIPDGAGAADFDARLSVIAGPQRVGECFPLGGVSDIEIGKLADKQIPLNGSRVSRLHCKLVRKDFAPSRWEIHDNHSTNGLFVNRQRIAQHELQDGDEIQIGEYTLTFASTYEHDIAAAKAAQSKALIAAGGKVCPGCGDAHRKSAKICVKCGIDLATGRPIVTSKGIDEDDLTIRADTWIRVISWFMPFGIFPIASEAFGTKRPIATFVIAGLIVVSSIVFTVAMHSDPPAETTLSMMHWTGEREAGKKEIEQEVRDHMSKQARRRPVSEEEMKEIIEEARAEFEESRPANVGFRWYQLFTHAWIHDPDLIRPFLFHLGGNLLFFFVFGLRVNELIGNVKMAIVYPLLIVGSAMIDHLAHVNAPLTPGVGASGVIMGLAGMYLVFFPLQKVHMSIWFRGGFMFGLLTLRFPALWQCYYKLWQMRGFWLLALWVGINDGLPMLFGARDHVGHWAHVGGFACGIAIALVMLVARLVNARGADLLSVTLGTRAWSLIGKPTERSASLVAS